VLAVCKKSPRKPAAIFFQGEATMGGPIVRTGTTPKFWQNWDHAFGKKKSGGSSSKPVATKKAAKKSTKTTAKKAGKKKK
jgi:hypothetical protein